MARVGFHRVNPPLPVPTNNVYRVKFIGVLENQMTVNVWYYRDNQPIRSATIESLMDLYTAISAPGGLQVAFMSCCTTDWQLNEVVLDSPTSVDLATAIAPQTNKKGVIPPPTEPSFVAACIQRLTGTKGQCGRGRLLMPAVATSLVTGSKLTNTSSYDTLASNMLAKQVGTVSTYTPVIWSRGPKPPTGQLRIEGVADITQVHTRQLLGTERRRVIGRGK